jgi:polyisoprenoid-binding protein YceI
VFEMRRVKPLGGNRFEVQGSLTIKGRSHDDRQRPFRGGNDI